MPYVTTRRPRIRGVHLRPAAPQAAWSRTDGPAGMLLAQEGPKGRRSLCPDLRLVSDPANASQSRPGASSAWTAKAPAPRPAPPMRSRPLGPRPLFLLAVLGIALLFSAAPQARAATPQYPATLPTTDAIMSDIEALVELGPRRSGTPGGDRAAEFVKAGLADAGVPRIWEHNVTTYQWEETHAKVSVGEEPIDAFASEHSFFGEPRGDWTGSFATPPGGRTAKVVDIRDGTPIDFATRDVRGKIVMFNLRFLAPLIGMAAVTEHLYDPGLSLLKEPRALVQGNPYITNYVSVLRAARAAGAVGFVGVLNDYFESNRYRNEYYRRLQVTMPGFWVTRPEANRMKRLLDQNGREATLELEGRRYATPTRTVIGLLPGKSDETIMVQSHHDSVGPGAVEDASGTASVLALARHYGARPLAERERSLLFVTFDSHFTGYQSHRAFMDDYLLSPTKPFPIIANATVEHIAKLGVVIGGKLVMRDSPEPRAFFRTGGREVRQTLVEAIRKHDLRRTALINGASIGGGAGFPTDAAFAAIAGVPTVSYIAGPVYLYDDVDTLDKIAVDQLRPVTASFVDIIDRFDRTPAAVLRGR